ncbi:GAF and ANTAR domain-containing protein [Carbonactinospora thermoautotrophica]|uniref:GAF and ANTAR domain-containing protein n=1 Tax=Carbonactinospora thermoautotrophica TaxID=1469144 RepID=UPI00082E4B64|nr:GAF and ANTAR domain-containing protein [Carbonactinospora thermoautotrophica]
MRAETLVRELTAIVDLTQSDHHSEPVCNRVVEAVVRSVPGCDGATLWLWRGEPYAIHTATHPDLARLDELQFQLLEGPGIEALAEHRTAWVPDTLHDEERPAFNTVAVRYGVRCCLALGFPIEPGGGLLQLYAARPYRLRRDLEPTLALIALQARAAIRNTWLYREAQAEAEQMRLARESSVVIEEAKGIIMHACGCDADEAFDRLRRISQHGQIKLVTVAQRLVNQVARRRAGAPRGTRADRVTGAPGAGTERGNDVPGAGSDGQAAGFRGRGGPV